MAILQASKKKTDWFDNTEGFRERLNYGETGERFVVSEFVKSGLFIPEWNILPFRKNSDENRVKKINANSKDLIVYRKFDGRQFHLEIKTRNLEFQAESNYPYDTIAIDTIEGWKAKVEKPDACIVVSNPLISATVPNSKTPILLPKYYVPCGAIAVIVTDKLQKDWTVKRLHDRDINAGIYTLMAPRSQFRTLQTLIKFLNDAR